MNLSLLKEMQLFYLSLLYGCFILFFYDVFRVFRRCIVHNHIAIALEDLIFWIITGLSIFTLLYRYNNGSIRAYCILGMGVGMSIYGIAVSPFFIKIALRIGKVLKKLLRKCKKSFIIISKRRKRRSRKKV